MLNKWVVDSAVTTTSQATTALRMLRENKNKFDQGSSEAVPDQKLNKKRKDQNGDEDEDPDEDEHENEDPTTQKKPRVVWSVELHRKFVAAVNILGIDKAVPKKILDLMNAEKLTRENKYRLYLKRISTVANQQANLIKYIPELPTHPGDTASFPVSSGFSDLKITAGSSNSPFVGISNKHLMLEEHGQGLQDGQNFGKQCSLSAGSLNPRYSSNFPDHGRCNDNRSNAVQSNGVQSNSLTLNDCFKRSILHPRAIKESMSTMALQSRNNPCDVSSISTLPIHLQDSKADLPCQVGVATVSSNAGQLINNGPLGWDDHMQDDPYHSNGLI
ncbi:hypothetical protein DKX38_027759 [Salix brachista]|uniref:Myb-like domain-containing protein n=1 Tax=Salix brachista TaxID=2182728 RepID=A0A5N5J939_9ROSI|nr:hypothetical protein DKX38_027759 [Salix brachista]